MTVTLEPTYGTVAAARMLGADVATVARWCWHFYPRVGSGGRYGLTHVDLMVMRAWKALQGPPGGEQQGSADRGQALRSLAENAIRVEPRRWLLLNRDGAQTFDEAEHAAAHMTGVGWLIDLEPYGEAN